MFTLTITNIKQLASIFLIRPQVTAKKIITYIKKCLKHVTQLQSVLFRKHKFNIKIYLVKH